MMLNRIRLMIACPDGSEFVGFVEVPMGITYEEAEQQLENLFRRWKAQGPAEDFVSWICIRGWVAVDAPYTYTLGIPEDLRSPASSPGGPSLPGAVGETKMPQPVLSYQELEDSLIADEPRLQRRERLGRRLSACVVANLEGDPEDMDEGELAAVAKQTYKQTYGCPIVGYLLLHIFISVIAQLIVRWIVKKWKERHPQTQPSEEFVCAASISLAAGAKAKLAQDRA